MWYLFESLIVSVLNNITHLYHSLIFVDRTLCKGQLKPCPNYIVLKRADSIEHTSLLHSAIYWMFKWTHYLTTMWYLFAGLIA